MNIEHVTLSYDGSRNHLEDVSTVIPKGKITTIIGPNGSGKSTLLRLTRSATVENLSIILTLKYRHLQKSSFLAS